MICRYSLQMLQNNLSYLDVQRSHQINFIETKKTYSIPSQPNVDDLVPVDLYSNQML